MSLWQYNYSSGSKYKASSLTSVHWDNTVEITSAANWYQQAYYIMKNIYWKTIFKHVNRWIPHICVK